MHGSHGRPMECYYIVISSTHLSNGHFRNIKGVFRGPLSKNGNKTLDYAEKENTIAKALEDFKANFYCELCDKQYYKHQEFDNHINSYDHAHKQRLKELKQREFARNVASKSRKDEKKQEKALQRLHKLAELRKEAVCAPGSGPMFKSTTVSVRDNFNEIPQSALADSINRQEDCKPELRKSTQKDKNVASVTPSSPEGTQNESKELGNQVHGHKVGFSFAFPKKTSVKLESSAAVFYEYNDEGSVKHGFSKKSRFVPGVCSLQSVLPTEIVLCSEEKDTCVSCLVENATGQAESSQPQKPTVLSGIADNSVSDPSCQLNVCADSAIEANPSSIESRECAPHDSCNDVLTIHANPTENSGPERSENKVPFQVYNTDVASLHEDQVKNGDSLADKAGHTQNISDILAPSNTVEDCINLQSKQDLCKRTCEAFVPVLSRDGSTILQWPSEMVSYTSAEPSVSFSCNPLCFDFKSSRLSDSLDKQKYQSSAPLNQYQKADDYQKGLVSDQAENEIECVNYDVYTSACKPDFDQVTSFLTDGTVAKSLDSTRTQDSLCAEVHTASCAAVKLEKHISKKYLEQASCTDDKNILTKEMHEKCFHKNRKRKRRRKLCQHSTEEIAKQVLDVSTASEQEHEDQCLERTSENHRMISDVAYGSDQLQQPYQKAESESNDCKGTESVLTPGYDDKRSCEIWDSKHSNEDSASTENLHKKYKTVKHRQSKQLLFNPGSHSLTYSRTFCNWRVRRLDCGLDHNHLSHQIDKCSDCNHSEKRAYSSLDEPEESCVKCRQCVHCSPPDKSCHKQIYLSEQQLSQVKHVTAPKPKRKRRRKRTRVYHAFVDKESRDRSFKPSDDETPLNIFREILAHGTVEDSIPHQAVDVHGNMEQARHLVQPSISYSDDRLSLEDNKSTIHSVRKNVSDDFSAYSSLNEESNLSSSTFELKENQNGLVHKGLTSHKMSSINRNFEPSPPKSYICHYELMDTVPLEKIQEATSEWLRYNSGILNSQPPLTFKEAHINHQTFLTTEQILAPLPLPDQRLLFLPEYHEKVKDLQCGAYQHMLQQNMVANKVKLTLPATAVQPSLLQPLPLQQPFCSTSITRIHHTILQQHAAAAAATAAMGTVKLLHPRQPLLSQVPALSRTPLPHISIGPGLGLGAHTMFVAPPHVSLIPASVVHPGHMSFPPLLQTTLLPPLSPHPTVIPLQPFF